jgi:hypothetical protein
MEKKVASVVQGTASVHQLAKSGIDGSIRSKIKCDAGKAISTVMEMVGGQMGGGFGIKAEKDFAIMTENQARLSTGLRTDGLRETKDGKNREDRWAWRLTSQVAEE